MRKYLRDKVSLADLADETGASPAQICQWTKALLESAEDVFSGKFKKAKRARDRALKKKDVKIVQLQEVTAELSSEVLWLKKGDGAGFLAYTDPAWKGKAVIANPLFGTTTSGMLGYLSLRLTLPERTAS